MYLSMSERKILEWLSEYYTAQNRNDLIEIIHALESDDEKKIEETYQFLNKKVQEIETAITTTTNAAAASASNASAVSSASQNTPDYNYMVLHAFCLNYGVGVAPQRQQAVQYFEKAQEQGILIATTLLGHFSRHSDPQKSNHLLTDAASKGEFIAQALLAYTKFTLSENEKEKIELENQLKTISETSKSTFVQYMYALILLRTTKKDQDFTELRNLSRQGYSLAQSMLGTLLYVLEKGKVNEVSNYQECMEWALQSLKQKNGIGAFLMGSVHIANAMEDKTKLDLNLLMHYLELSAQYGVESYSDPLFTLLQFFQDKANPDPKRITALRTVYLTLRDAVQKSKFPAAHEMYNLGFFLYHGIGLSSEELKDPALFQKGIDLIRQAANRQHTLAEIHFGFCHEFGIGIPQSTSEAYRYYESAYWKHESNNYGIDESFRQLMDERHLECEELWSPLTKVLGNVLSDKISPERCQSLIAEYAFNRKMCVSYLNFKNYSFFLKNFEARPKPLLSADAYQEDMANQKSDAEDLIYTTIADYAGFFEDNAVEKPRSHSFLEDSRKQNHRMYLSMQTRRKLEWLTEYYERLDRQDLIEIIQTLSSGDEGKLKEIYLFLNKKVQELESNTTHANAASAVNAASAPQNTPDYNYMVLFAFCLDVGLGVVEQSWRAAEYIRKAHQQGILIATTLLASTRKHYTDPKEQNKILTLAAKQGEPIAKATLVHKNETKETKDAVKIQLKTICETNKSLFVHFIYATFLYQNENNSEEALLELRDLANRGYSSAQMILIQYLLNSEASQRGYYKEYMEWARRSLEKNNGDTSMLMFNINNNELASNANLNLSLDYLLLSAQYATLYTNREPLGYFLNIKTRENPEFRKTITPELRAVYLTMQNAVENFEFPQAHAVYNLGFFLFHGIGLTEEELQDEALLHRGIDLIKRAADRELALAQIHIAYCYEFGVGVPRSVSRAFQYSEQAYEEDEDEDDYGIDEAFGRNMRNRHVSHQKLWLPLKTALEENLPSSIRPEQTILITEYAYEGRKAYLNDCLFLFNAFEAKLNYSDTMEAQQKDAANQKAVAEELVRNTIADYGAFIAHNEDAESTVHPFVGLNSSRKDGINSKQKSPISINNG